MCVVFVVGKQMYTEWTTGNISEANVRGQFNDFTANIIKASQCLNASLLIIVF